MSIVRARGSPFQCGSDIVFLPEMPFKNELTIRVESGGTFKVYIKTIQNPGEEVSSTNADYFLDSGDSITFKRDKIKDISQVHFLTITGDPLIFWDHI